MALAKTDVERGFAKAAECLKVLAHPHRLQMVEQIIRHKMTVGELAEECGLAQAVASGHLRLLQRCGLLRPEREGRSVTYVVADPCLKKIMACVVGRFISHTDNQGE